MASLEMFDLRAALPITLFVQVPTWHRFWRAHGYEEQALLYALCLGALSLSPHLVLACWRAGASTKRAGKEKRA